jgi:uncharacterized protein (DUF2141 family)
MKTLVLLFISAPFLFFSSSKSNTGTLNITIENVSNKEGTIRVLLFEENKGFPDKPENALLSRNVEISNMPVIFEMKDVPYGEYALSILHDENNNRKMDTNFLKIPQEGYGFSNNASARFSAPDFEEAAFKLESESKSMKIKLKY